MGQHDVRTLDGLEGLLNLIESSARHFPELPGVTERVILLLAASITDDAGRFDSETLAQVTAMKMPTLQRFLLAFQKLGLVEEEDAAEGILHLSDRAVMDLRIL